ncbi:MAG: dihydrodipicolinate synthase family protein [Candidatus Eremiobacteraeota bacterium]|nr:dihydrodipicolinate synthase family protein [Candidatus Eremiobacteraeota bacterium]
MTAPLYGTATGARLTSSALVRRVIRASLCGVCAAVLTPLDQSLRPDAPRAIPYYRELLDSGCEALNIPGTTGEAMSIATQDRIAYMQAISLALPTERLMVGTGAAALAEAIALAKAAFACGFGAALVMPPFYYKDVSERGIVDYFARLIDAVRPPPASLLLYHFPALSFVPFSDSLVGALLSRFPDTIAGMKDSANDLALDRRLSVHTDFALYPGSEKYLLDAREAGFAGIISGTVALWPQLAARVWEDGDADEARRLSLLRRGPMGRPLVSAVRKRVAEERKDVAWLRSIPPL